MIRRQLGANGPTISPVGVGTWVMGGPWLMGWGPQDDDESIQTLRAAWDAGVNWVDTAPIYGFGHAEDVTRRALAGRDDVLVFTKCAVQWDDANRLQTMDLRPDAIRAECEASLRRLGRDHIDLYQLHFPDPKTPIEETWEAMAGLVDAGKVRYLGISNHTLDQVQRAHAVRPVDALQIRTHLLDQRNTVEVLPWCADSGVGALIYSPIASGLLAGPLDMDSLPEDDWRRRDERFLQEQKAAPDVLDAIARELPDERPEAVAVAWVMAQRGVSGAIVGVRNPAELASLARAAELDLSAAQLTALSESPGAAAQEARPLW